jgi:thiamine-monophosphate kinase
VSFELDFIEALRRRVRSRLDVPLGIGDDMAVLLLPRPESGPPTSVLLASDLLLDGVHFDAGSQPLGLIGRKAVACNLSDCAAMAVRPAACVISLALPRAMSREAARELFEGMVSIAEEYDLAVVGGDTTRWDQPLAIDVAILATPFPNVTPVRRSGARVGDALFVTGPLGGSLSGKHLTFRPRVEEARRLAGALGDRLHAMIDISDGLSLDLWRMCAASGVGAELEEGWVQGVVSEAARRASLDDGRSPLDHALSDGEDFELLLAVSPECDVLIEGVSLLPVGRITASELTLRRLDGCPSPLEPRGYLH